MFKGFIFDLDGTIYLSDRLIPAQTGWSGGSGKRGGRLFFSPTSRSRPGGLFRQTDTARYSHPTGRGGQLHLVMIHYLNRIAPHARVFVVGELPFVEEMRSGVLP